MQVRDPVCGKSFDIDRSAGTAEHEGWMYFFCSSECQLRFGMEPARYVETRRRARPAGSAATVTVRGRS